MNIHVFDAAKLSRPVLDRTWPNMTAKTAENDPKMAAQNDPKSSKNRCQKMIEILIDKKGGRVVFLSRPGGMRWPPGGIIGGAKNSLFEICRCLRHVRALRCTDFGFRSSMRCSTPPGRAADSIAMRIPPHQLGGLSTHLEVMHFDCFLLSKHFKRFRLFQGALGAFSGPFETVLGLS